MGLESKPQRFGPHACGQPLAEAFTLFHNHKAARPIPCVAQQPGIPARLIHAPPRASNVNSKPFKYLALCLAGLIALGMLTAYRLQAFDLSSHPSRTLVFKHADDRLEGTLVLPRQRQSPPVVLIIHGDGAQDRWSADGYAPLLNYLLDQGIGVFAWDKPGVGASQGNWLAQSMDDRAAEAAAAMKRLRNEASLKHSPMGFLGFSQAGWVVPQASEWAHADFAVLVGPAINWRDQGLYYLRHRLTAQQLPPAEVSKAVQHEAASFDALFTPATAALPCTAPCTREDFERRNALADARTAIASMHTPVMILMGEMDRNVDPEHTLAAWAEQLPDDTARCIRQVPAATHGLLRSSVFDYQLSSQWPWHTKAIFLMAGYDAYAPGALKTIASWIRVRKCSSTGA